MNFIRRNLQRLMTRHENPVRSRRATSGPKPAPEAVDNYATARPPSKVVSSGTQMPAPQPPAEAPSKGTQTSFPPPVAPTDPMAGARQYIARARDTAICPVDRVALMTDAVSLSCGHSFSEASIARLLGEGPDPLCPCCRHEICEEADELRPNLDMRAFAAKLIAAFGENGDVENASVATIGAFLAGLAPTQFSATQKAEPTEVQKSRLASRAELRELIDILQTEDWARGVRLTPTPDLLQLLAEVASDVDMTDWAEFALRLLGHLDAAAGKECAVALLEDGRRVVRFAAQALLGAADPRTQLRQAKEHMADTESILARQAGVAQFWSLVELPASNAVIQQLEKMTYDSSAFVRADATEHFAKITGVEGHVRLAELLGDSNGLVRQAAYDAGRTVGLFGRTALTSAEVQMLDKDPLVRACGLIAYVENWLTPVPQVSLDHLLFMTHDEDPLVRGTALRLLRAYAPKAVDARAE